jgi:hypothetical protein
METYLNSLLSGTPFDIMNTFGQIPPQQPETSNSSTTNYEIYTNWINRNMYESVHFTNINRDRQIHELVQLQLMFSEQLDEQAPRNHIDFVVMLPQNIQGTFGPLEAILETMFNHFRGAEQSDVILPLTDDAISKLPVKKFKEIMDSESENCSICQEKYDSEADVIILPCKHYFHKACITEWLKNYHHKCPLCRMPCGEHTANM